VEFRAISEFLQSAAERTSGFVIEGEAGIGKTTLWLDALEQAHTRGFRVLSAQVGEAETVLAYAAVAREIRELQQALAELLRGRDLDQLAPGRVERVNVRGPPWIIRTMGRPGKDRDRNERGFLRSHSLSLTTGAILVAWLVLYAKSDPRTHHGAFFGNAVADWSGSFALPAAPLARAHKLVQP